MKKCNNCQRVLPKTQFYPKQAICMFCDRDRKWLGRYNLSPEEYLELYNNQDGRCGICGAYPEEKNLAVDHDKSTGEIRGLLCFKCNIGIGLLGDTLEGVERAIRYLKREFYNE